MAITITAKLESQGVKDGVKDVESELDRMSTHAEDSGNALSESLASVNNESDALKKKYKELGEQLEKVGDDGSEAAQEITRQMSETDGAINKAYLEAKLLEAELAGIDGGGMDKLDQVAQELQGELAELKGRTEALKAELASMGATGEDSLEGVGDAAKGTGDSLKSIGAGAAESRDKIQTVAVAYLAVADVVSKVAELGKKAGEAIAWMAENGNPAAIELQESFQDVKQSILDIAEDPAFQDFLGEIAITINEDVIPAIKAIPDAWVSSQDWLEDSIVGLGESIGVFAEGTREAMDEMQAADKVDRESRKGRLGAIREEREQKASLTKVEEELAKIAQARSDDEIRASLERIKTEEELQDVIDDLTESIREQAKEGKLSDEDRESGLKKIAAAEGRLKQLKADNASSEKAAADESVKIAADAAAERDRIAKAESDNKARIANEALDNERKSIEERKRLLSGGDVKGAESVLGAQTREQVRDAYAAQQGGDAALKANYESGGDQKAIEAARKKAMAAARRDFDSGKAESDDIRAAQVELANNAADAGVAQGKVSKETAQATKEAIAELARTQNEMDQVQAEMASMRQLMNGVQQQGNRRRAQVAGAGR